MMHIMAKLLRPFSIMKICNMKSIGVTKPKICMPPTAEKAKKYSKYRGKMSDIQDYTGKIQAKYRKI